jgi:hypothetical protein
MMAIFITEKHSRFLLQGHCESRRWGADRATLDPDTLMFPPFLVRVYLFQVAARDFVAISIFAEKTLQPIWSNKVGNGPCHRSVPWGIHFEPYLRISSSRSRAPVHRNPVQWRRLGALNESGLKP